MAFNQIAYQDNYNRCKYKMYQFRVKKEDSDIISFLDKQDNKNQYILSLIENGFNVYTLKQLKDLMKPVFRKYEINEIYLFGSYARGEATKDSDVDIYCSKGKVRSLIDQGRLIDELEEVLKKKVDIVFDTSEMNEYFKNQIMEDMIKLC